MRRSEWLKLYTTEDQTDPKTGKPKTYSRYIGPWYTWEPQKRKACVWKLWLGLVLAAAAFVIAGLTPSWGSMCIYVSLWYMLCLLPLFYLLLGTWKMTRMQATFTEVDRAEGPGYVRRASLGLGVLGAAWAVADGIFLLLTNLSMTQAEELIFLGCGAATAAVGLVLHGVVRRVVITPKAG